MGLGFSSTTVSSCNELRERMPEFLACSEPVVAVNMHNWESNRQFFDAVKAAKAATFDFDGTLHAGNQWALLREHCMTPEHAANDKAEADMYWSRSGQRSVDQDISFICRSVLRMIRSNTSLRTLQEASCKIELRPGAFDLLESFEPHARCIVSFGIKDCILASVPLPISVYALGLKFDGSRLVGYVLKQVVTDANKAYQAAIFRAKHGFLVEETLAVGDSLTDIGLMDRKGPGVLIIPRHDLHSERALDRIRNLEPLFDRVGAFLIGDSLEPLTEIRRGDY